MFRHEALGPIETKCQSCHCPAVSRWATYLTSLYLDGNCKMAVMTVLTMWDYYADWMSWTHTYTASTQKMSDKIIKGIKSWTNGGRYVSKIVSSVFSPYSLLTKRSCFLLQIYLSGFCFLSWCIILVTFPRWWKQIRGIVLTIFNGLCGARSTIGFGRCQGINWYSVLIRALDGPLVPCTIISITRWAHYWKGISVTWFSISAASQTRACVIFSEMMTPFQDTGTWRTPNYVWWFCLVVKGMRHDRNFWS